MSLLERPGTPIDTKVAYGHHSPEGRLLGVVDPSKSLYACTGQTRFSTFKHRSYLTFGEEEWDFVKGTCAEIEHVSTNEVLAIATEHAIEVARPVRARFKTHTVVGIPATALDAFDAQGDLIRKATR